MDQSTQVNFPIVSKNQHRKMRRHNTSADLFLNQNKMIPLTNSWSQLKPIALRPKSLNFSTEAFNRTKLMYASESPLSRLSHPGLDTPVGSISRERTPPFSCSSSVTSNGGISSYKPPPYALHKKMQDDESSGSVSGSKCCCRCYDVESGRINRQLSNTPEGLSWRRLHMSRAKLKATATTSELLSGFAMIAMVELQINTPTNVPEWLFVMFAVCTTVLVAVHIFALMISTYILPNIEAIAKLEICEMVKESPHERMKGFIEIAWAFSTILGLFLFLIEVAILCWVKFWDYSFTAAVAATVIVIPVLITFVLFAAHFYHSLVVYKCDKSTSDMEKLEDIKKHLDEATVTV
ncbi:calcium release-activated calcium channel protein 1-like isoform X2 [Anoplophora glabripennis]|nr:calcium release-activated calcium channel protein 1-like isoform X2 [Anoplophora glabripennis]